MFACMAGTAIISLISVGEYSRSLEHLIGGNESIKIASLVVFALLGFPLAVRFNALAINSNAFAYQSKNLCLFVSDYLSFADHI